MERNEYLVLGEVIDALRFLHASITCDEAQDMFLRYDRDQNGRLSREEFALLYEDYCANER